MNIVTTAIAPILLLLALGWILRHRLVNDPGFWRGLEFLSYRVFTPALFVVSISGAEATEVPLEALSVGLVVPVIAVSCMVLALKRVMRADGPRVTSLVQGSIRINTYIGLVFAAALHGDAGVATFALASTLMVPLVNVVSVLVLTVHGTNAISIRPARIVRELFGNPLIQACVVGLGLSLLDVDLPAFLASTLGMLAEPAPVSGTLAVGAAITLQFRRSDLLDIAFTSGVKLVALPLVAGALAHALGAEGALLTSIVLICAVPTAPSSYVLASRMGGDARLMASITGVQTLVAIVTLPILLT
ncbi:MAG TPA: AEC family transporter [Ornithinibacter sp.]|nr:AEC family transporter [Ornithinibacter sp.]